MEERRQEGVCGVCVGAWVCEVVGWWEREKGGESARVRTCVSDVCLSSGDAGDYTVIQSSDNKLHTCVYLINVCVYV